MSEENNKEPKAKLMNVEAKEYVPTKKQQAPEKLDFNLDAKEFKPKENQEEKVEYVEGDDDEDLQEEEVKDQMDMIMRDVVENDVMNEMYEGSDDEDKWLPKYKDCECCHGFVYKCTGESCQALGQCFCKMKDDCEELEDQNN